MPSGICVRCGLTRPWLHKHHVKFRCDGGVDSDGLEMLCANCHEDVHEGPMGGKSTMHKRHTPAARAKRATAQRALWSTPEYKQRMREARLAQWAEGGRAREAISRKYATRDAAILRLRAEGRLLRDIAEELDCGWMTVRRVLRRNGIATPTERPAVREQRKRILEMAQRGATSAEIAEELGISQSHAGRTIKVARDKGRLSHLTPQEEARKLRNEQIRVRLSEGRSQQAIAREFGVSRALISKVARGLTAA